jgi:hypothetical protein
MKKVTDRRKNIISHVKGTLDTILRVEANSASCYSGSVVKTKI